MRFLIEPVVAITCALTGAGFYLLLWAIMDAGAREDESMARIRAADDAEQLAHIRRFSAAMAVLDMDAYRARKANAPAMGSRPPHDALAGRLESQPGAESLPNNLLEFKHHA